MVVEMAVEMVVGVAAHPRAGQVHVGVDPPADRPSQLCIRSHRPQHQPQQRGECGRGGVRRGKQGMEKEDFRRRIEN